MVWGTSEHLSRDDILMVTRFDRETPLRWFEPEHSTLPELVQAVETDAILQALRHHGSTRKAAGGPWHLAVCPDAKIEGI